MRRPQRDEKRGGTPRRAPGAKDTRIRCRADGDSWNMEGDGDVPGGHLVLRTSRNDVTTGRKVACMSGRMEMLQEGKKHPETMTQGG